MARTILWAVLAVAIAFGGAGLIGQLSHPPGDTRRAELTWAGDQALGSRLDDVSNRLTVLGTQVDALSGDAKDALIAVSSGDADKLTAALDRGAQRAATIDATAAQLQAALAGMPGDAPADATRYANTTIFRRGLLLNAVGAVGALSDEWTRVTAKSSEAASLTLAIRSHDSTLASAASAGVQARYAQAVELCKEVLTILDQISGMRSDFVQPDQVTILDDWIARHLRYDKALLALYQALLASGGIRNLQVDAAYREQTFALAQLPPNNGEIVVIIAQVAQGGLNDAVLAIEDARGKIDDAIAEAVPSTPPG